MNRQQLSDDEVMEGVADMITKLRERLVQRGYGTFTSRHEILGVIQEEMHELCEAVQKDGHEHIRQELLDIAVGAVFGAICLKKNKVDW